MVPLCHFDFLYLHSIFYINIKCLVCSLTAKNIGTKNPFFSQKKFVLDTESSKDLVALQRTSCIESIDDGAPIQYHVAASCTHAPMES